MPIGKNAIKRVVSSGYSAPKTTDDTKKKVEEIKEAPVAVEEKATKSAPKKAAPKKTTTPKTSSAKPKQPAKAPKSEAAEEMVAVVKETKIEVVKSEDSARECQYFSIGEDLPIYLL